MTKTLTLTQTDATDIHGALFAQLVVVRRTIHEGYGSVELADRLEVLCDMFHNMRVEFPNPHKVGA